MAMGEINKNGDSSSLHAVSRCVERSLRGRRSKAMCKAVGPPCSLAADLFTRGGLCFYASSAHVACPLLYCLPIMHRVTVNRADKNMDSHSHMTLLPRVFLQTKP